MQNGKCTDTWKMQLTIYNNFIISKDDNGKELVSLSSIMFKR